MIVLLAIIIVALSAFEITHLYKKRQKKEIVLYISLAVISFLMGCLYILNPLGKSIAYYALALFGLE